MAVTPERRRRILGIALPIIGAMTSQNILNLVDTAMVGALGAAALAGVGMASFLHFMAVGGITGLSSAVQAMAARRQGEGRVDESAVPLNGGLLIALTIGLPLGVLLCMASPAIMSLLVDDPTVVEEGAPYMALRMLAIWAVGMNFSFRGFWNGTDRSRLYLYTLLVMHVANVLLNYVLIFGKLGFPAMGTSGAALGTVIATLLGTTIYFVLAWREARPNGFMARMPGRAQMGSLMKLGIPASIQQFMFAAGFTALFWIIAQVGTAEMAVANVLINITLVAVLPAIGLGLAAATLVGQALGRADPVDAHAWAWDVVKVAALIFIALGLPMLLAPQWVLSAFLHTDELRQLGQLPLQMVGAGIVLDGTGLILMQALLGAGAAGLVMRIGIGMQWLLFLPIAYVLGPVAGFGLLAIWGAFMGYRFLQAALFCWYWERRGWTGIQV